MDMRSRLIRSNSSPDVSGAATNVSSACRHTQRKVTLEGDMKSRLVRSNSSPNVSGAAAKLSPACRQSQRKVGRTRSQSVTLSELPPVMQASSKSLSRNAHYSPMDKKFTLKHRDRYEKVGSRASTPSSCFRDGNVSSSLSSKSSSNSSSISPAESPNPSSRGSPNESNRAVLLASMYNLPFHEVERMTSELDKIETDANGCITPQDFKKWVCSVFDVPAVDYKTMCEARREAHANNQVNMNKFLAWYQQNMFRNVCDLKACPQRKESRDIVRRVAGQIGLSASVVETIKHEFDRYDGNKDGVIEYEEFADMLKTLLRVNDKDDLTSNRIQRFWKHIDADQNGTVDFSEFASWYVKSFSPSGKCNLVEAFYESFSPSVQRNLALRGSRGR